MSMLGNAAKLSRLIQIGRRNEGLSLLLRDSRRCFSTEAEQPSQGTQDSLANAFLQSQDTGVVFGRLGGSGFGKQTTKSDIVRLLEGCDVGLDDLKVHYNYNFLPTGMLIQFHSPFAYDAAMKTIKKIGFYRLDGSARSEWDRVAPYDGKSVLLQGIPHYAALDDVERFLSGCMYDASTMQMFVRVSSTKDPIRMAVVHFPSQTQAIHAFITKNRSFCLNNQVLVRVLY